MAKGKPEPAIAQTDSFEDYLDKAVTFKRGTRDSKPTLAILDQYAILHRLGGGEFGAVYLAHDTDAKIDVVVKGLPPLISNDAEELVRIRDNFALVSRLHHPHIAPVLHLQRLKSTIYYDTTVQENLRLTVGDMLMVMAYAPGMTVSQWRRQFPERRAPVDQAIQIAKQIAQALDYAHGENVLHRDVKPSNVIVEQRLDGSITARLIDFDLATEMSAGRTHTVADVDADTVGTWPYMAPEQWNHEEQCAATDQYGLAVLLCYLLTGTVPFASAFTTNDLSTIKMAVCTRPLELPDSCPCRSSFQKALSRLPSARFASCEEFVEAVEKELRKRIKAVAPVVGAVVLVGILATTWLLWRDSSSNPENPISAPPVVQPPPKPTQNPAPPVVQQPPKPTPKPALPVVQQPPKPTPKPVPPVVKLPPKPTPKPALPVVQQPPKPAPKPAPPVVQLPPKPAPKPVPPKVEQDPKIKRLLKEAEEAQKEGNRQEQLRRLDVSIRGINDLKKIARKSYEKSQPFRDDTTGLENHLNRFDTKFNDIVNCTMPQNADEADHLLRAMSQTINDMLNELKWLEDNANSQYRMDAKNLFQEIERSILPKCRGLKELGFINPFLDEGEKLLTEAKETFKAGQFQMTLNFLQRAKGSLHIALQQQSSKRLKWLVSRVKSCHATGDWNGCIQAAEAVMIIDPMNLEVELLLEEARSKLTSPGR